MPESVAALSSPAHVAPSPRPVTVPAHGLPALRLLPAPPCEPPYDDELAPALRLVPHPPVRRRPVTGRRPLPPPVPVRPVLDGLPDARPAAVALVHRLLEVRGGVRPVAQLRPDTTPGLFAQLEQALRPQRQPAGPRPTGRDVCSIHVQQRSDGTAEVCATVRRGERVAALALRLEHLAGRWTCTVVQGL